jgi:integrase
MRGTIDYQAKIAWNYVNGIGKKKGTLRDKSDYFAENGHKVSGKIHVLTRKDEFIRITKNILNHQKELGLKADLHTISKPVLESWVGKLIEKGNKADSISTYLSLVKVLVRAIEQIPIPDNLNKKSDVVPLSHKDIENIRVGAREVAQKSVHVNRAYTNPHALGVHLEGKFELSYQLQRDYGLRVTAATKIKPEQLKPGNKLEFVNKGGKRQTIKIDPLLHKQLRVSTSQKDGHHLGYHKYLRAIKKAVKLSGQKYNATHGFRYSYAQGKVYDLRQENFGGIQAKLIVSHRMGHKRLNITDHYLHDEI